MSEVYMPRHRGKTILSSPHGRLKLALNSTVSMFDLSGQMSFRLMEAEMPDPGRRRGMPEVSILVTNQMTPPPPKKRLND